MLSGLARLCQFSLVANNRPFTPIGLGSTPRAGFLNRELVYAHIYLGLAVNQILKYKVGWIPSFLFFWCK